MKHCPQQLPGLSGLAGQYDAFLLDSWGVLQDGVCVLDGVNDCLQALRKRGKQLAILTNSARRSETVAGELAKTGLAMELIDHVISGGEAAWQALKHRPDEQHQRLGKSCFYLGSQRSSSLLLGLDLELTSSLDKAGFILCTSPPDDSSDSSIQETLARGAARELTMVCANPDLIAYHGDEARFCAGEIARRYEAIGGQVIYHGKPHAPFYQMALAELGLAPSRILAVGDAFATDMAGAATASVDALMVMGGIHRDSLSNEATRGDELNALCREHDLWPIAAVPHFTW